MKLDDGDDDDGNDDEIQKVLFEVTE